MREIGRPDDPIGNVIEVRSEWIDGAKVVRT